jgi:hypothetical protein
MQVERELVFLLEVQLVERQLLLLTVFLVCFCLALHLSIDFFYILLSYPGIGPFSFRSFMLFANQVDHYPEPHATPRTLRSFEATFQMYEINSVKGILLFDASKEIIFSNFTADIGNYVKNLPALRNGLMTRVLGSGTHESQGFVFFHSFLLIHFVILSPFRTSCNRPH